jgi:hypothetical protein
MPSDTAPTPEALRSSLAKLLGTWIRRASNASVFPVTQLPEATSSFSPARFAKLAGYLTRQGLLSNTPWGAGSSSLNQKGRTQNPNGCALKTGKPALASLAESSSGIDQRCGSVCLGFRNLILARATLLLAGQYRCRYACCLHIRSMALLLVSANKSGE